jgi:hypothetical protein
VVKLTIYGGILCGDGELNLNFMHQYFAWFCLVLLGFIEVMFDLFGSWHKI